MRARPAKRQERHDDADSRGYRAHPGRERSRTARVLMRQSALLIAGLVVAGAYLLLSIITFAVYAFDKASARRASRRVPESSLHVLSLLGGWPGALAAQRLLRHKTRKQPFRRVFWLTVLLNCLALALLAYAAVRGAVAPTVP